MQLFDCRSALCSSVAAKALTRWRQKLEIIGISVREARQRDKNRNCRPAARINPVTILDYPHWRQDSNF
jgi:hypothetical protein